jgi:transcriptional regulator GlxA family with amidase domain
MSESLVRYNDQKIDESVDYMLSHLHQSLKMTALAKMVNYSASHFFTIFKRKTGYPPNNYLIRLRMKRACYFLEATNMDVKKIAETLGYKDQFYFSRLFKSVNEVAPTAYRAKARSTALSLLKLPSSTIALSKASKIKHFSLSKI